MANSNFFSSPMSIATKPLPQITTPTDNTLSSANVGDAALPSGGRHHRDSNRVHKSSSEHKPTRVRTVLNEKQLHTLRSCYNANPRPDALMKEQLVEMTGLSPRVIRVWFQNKRCKDKKRSILIKQMQQQEKVSIAKPKLYTVRDDVASLILLPGHASAHSRLVQFAMHHAIVYISRRLLVRLLYVLHCMGLLCERAKRSRTNVHCSRRPSRPCELCAIKGPSTVSMRTRQAACELYSPTGLHAIQRFT